MARLARVVVPALPHHVTQRGNGRRPVFTTDADRLVYLDLLASNCRLYHLSILGFCLMSNHVHLVAVPRRADAMGLALRNAHGRYASYLNALEGNSGHVWQGRYYSCPLDTDHLWAALRYSELNPVRAGMVAAPELYRWSSAAAHCGLPNGGLPLGWIALCGTMPGTRSPGGNSWSKQTQPTTLMRCGQTRTRADLWARCSS